MVRSSFLLLDEPPLSLQRNVVRAVGGHDLALFVQQIHYVASSANGQEHDGHRWAVRTAAEWCDDLVFTPKQLRRVISTLTTMGVVVRWQPDGYDRTAWSRLDVDELQRRADASGPNGRNGIRPKRARSVRPNGPDPSGPNGPDVPLSRELQTSNEEGRSSESIGAPLTLIAFPARTTNQLARDMQVGFWEWVSKQTGRPPLSVNPVGFQRLMAHFIDAKVTRKEIGDAVCALYSEGRPITRATIEAQIDGRRPRRAARQAVDDQLAELRYDAAGNLV